MTETLREKVARAIYKAQMPESWIGEGFMESSIDEADAAIAIVLEEAAKVAEKAHVKPYHDRPLNFGLPAEIAHEHGKEIAADIRNLKDK